MGNLSKLNLDELNLDKYKNYISILLFVFFFLVLYFFNIHNNLVMNNCKRLNEEESLNSRSSRDDYEIKQLEKLKLFHNDDEKNEVRRIVLKSAFNCCCSGGTKNDFVDFCALKHCAQQNIRVLDFQIFSLKNNPIVSASTQNDSNYKEIYNHLSFSETIDKVDEYFLSEPNPHSNNVLFLNLRIHSGNIEIYNKISEILVNKFTNSTKEILYYSKKIENYTLEELKNKIIIMVDIIHHPKYIPIFEASKLYKITLISFGKNFENSAHNENNSELQTLNKLSSIYPNNTSTAKNYDFMKGIENKYVFIYMNIQTKDIYLKEYNRYFGDLYFKIV